MRFYQKILPAALALCLACPTALAADLQNSPTATGTVRSSHTQDITAPYSGTLKPFDWALGDSVSAGAELISLDTTKVYAPCAGTVGALFAQVGDDAQSVSTRYGGVAAIEPANAYVLEANTRSAYDDAENRHIHIGETLYFKSTSSSRVTGVGRVIAVEGISYRVEMTQGDLELDETVTLYRDPLYDRESVVGRGSCKAVAPVFAQGAGRVLRVHAKEGDVVAAGDLLYETAAQDADSDLRSEQLNAPFDGVISALNAASGQQVAKGQVLLTLSDATSLEVTCDVDEIDLGSLAVGESLCVVFDFAPDTVYQGTISEISALGTLRQNAAYYTVTLSLGDVPGLRLGMSATVYLLA